MSEERWKAEVEAGLRWLRSWLANESQQAIEAGRKERAEAFDEAINQIDSLPVEDKPSTF